MIDFSGVSIPFGVGDLLSGAVDLLFTFGPFVLLVLAVSFAPQLMDLIKFAVTGEREKDGYIYGRNGSVIGYVENGKKTVLGNLKRMSRHRD